MAICTSSGTTFCMLSRTSRRRSLRRMVIMRAPYRWSIRRPCANCSQSLVHVASASSSPAVTTALALETASLKVKRERSSLCPLSLHHVHMMIPCSTQVQYKSLTRPPCFRRSLCHKCRLGGMTGDHPEMAASISGGNFSNYFPRPGYQEDASTSAFLQTFGDHEYAGLYKCVFCCDLLQVSRTILTS